MEIITNVNEESCDNCGHVERAVAIHKNPDFCLCEGCINTLYQDFLAFFPGDDIKRGRERKVYDFSGGGKIDNVCLYL